MHYYVKYLAKEVTCTAYSMFIDYFLRKTVNFSFEYFQVPPSIQNELNPLIHTNVSIPISIFIKRKTLEYIRRYEFFQQFMIEE